MDPNANLKETRALVARMIANEQFPDEMKPSELQAYAHDAARLVDLAEALDEWISKGGFLPDAWRR